MRYLGGKFRLASRIAQVLEANRKPGQTYVEPFVGSGAVTAKMTGFRVASDINEDLIALHRAIQAGWVPPDCVSQEEYERCRNFPDKYTPYKRAFIGLGCSWGGKLWGGYARGEGRNYAAETRRSLLKMRPNLLEVIFTVTNYQMISFSNTLIYCDPPYLNSVGYPFLFDSKAFWETTLSWARQDNTVIVSEYQAPSWAAPIAEFPILRNLQGASREVTERLFLVA